MCAFEAFQLAYVAGLGAFLGHLFPVWLRFVGGKGVATYIGVLLGAALAGGTRLLPGVDRGRRDHALLLACRHWSQPLAVVLYYLLVRPGGSAVHSHHVAS